MTAALALMPALATPAHATAGADEAEIRAALHAWVEASNRGDVEAMSSIWAPDLVGWYPGMPDYTYEVAMAQKKAAAEKPNQPPPARTEVDIVEVMLAGDMAVVRDIWTFTGTRPDKSTSTTKIKSYEVWARQPDKHWKISRWISAPELQAPPA
jgi:uncharacterized protein (TIGR02246 family)